MTWKTATVNNVADAKSSSLACATRMAEPRRRRLVTYSIRPLAQRNAGTASPSM